MPIKWKLVAAEIFRTTYIFYIRCAVKGLIDNRMLFKKSGVIYIKKNTFNSQVKKIKTKIFIKLSSIHAYYLFYGIYLLNPKNLGYGLITKNDFSSIYLRLK